MFVTLHLRMIHILEYAFRFFFVVQFHKATRTTPCANRKLLGTDINTCTGIKKNMNPVLNTNTTICGGVIT